MYKQTITVYRGRPNKQWRWRMQSANRKIVGASGEAFTRLSRCLVNLYQVTGIWINQDNYPKKFGDKARFSVQTGTRKGNGFPVRL